MVKWEEYWIKRTHILLINWKIFNWFYFYENIIINIFVLQIILFSFSPIRIKLRVHFIGEESVANNPFVRTKAISRSGLLVATSVWNSVVSPHRIHICLIDSSLRRNARISIWVVVISKDIIGLHPIANKFDGIYLFFAFLIHRIVWTHLFVMMCVTQCDRSGRTILSVKPPTLQFDVW